MQSAHIAGSALRGAARISSRAVCSSLRSTSAPRVSSAFELVLVVDALAAGQQQQRAVGVADVERQRRAESAAGG